MNAYCSVVPDALIDVLLNPITYCNSCPSRTPIINNNRPPAFQYFHAFANFPLAHTVNITLNCHSSVNFTKVYTLSPLILIERHVSILMHFTNGTVMLNA
jgi:hypothetical protein